MSIEKLNNCIKNKKANNSRAREAIYNLLLETQECLNVVQILKRLSISYPKKILQNTLYRHLNFFVECDLVIVIQDDSKRSYYYPKENSLMTFSVCTRCNNIRKLATDASFAHHQFDTAEFITIHKICSHCTPKT